MDSPEIIFPPLSVIQLNVDAPLAEPSNVAVNDEQVNGNNEANRHAREPERVTKDKCKGFGAALGCQPVFAVRDVNQARRRKTQGEADSNNREWERKPQHRGEEQVSGAAHPTIRLPTTVEMRRHLLR